LSAGIPVFATDVGVTPEIIDDTVGKLLPVDITPSDLALCIQNFATLSSEEKFRMRAKAFDRFQERCNAEELYDEFARFLVSDN
jgi:glycosyltransferase involved in cell wall biosynthesis